MPPSSLVVRPCSKEAAVYTALLLDLLRRSSLERAAVGYLVSYL